MVHIYLDVSQRYNVGLAVQKKKSTLSRIVGLHDKLSLSFWEKKHERKKASAAGEVVSKQLINRPPYLRSAKCPYPLLVFRSLPLPCPYLYADND
jgi:hypothetical protein